MTDSDNFESIINGDAVNDASAPGGFTGETDRSTGEYHYKNGYTQKIYSDAHYVPAEENTVPPRYYTPPEKAAKEPARERKKGGGKVIGMICLCLVCALLGGIGGAAIVSGSVSDRMDALESDLAEIAEAQATSRYRRSSTLPSLQELTRAERSVCAVRVTQVLTEADTEIFISSYRSSPTRYLKETATIFTVRYPYPMRILRWVRRSRYLRLTERRSISFPGERRAVRSSFLRVRALFTTTVRATVIFISPLLWRPRRIFRTMQRRR